MMPLLQGRRLSFRWMLERAACLMLFWGVGSGTELYAADVEPLGVQVPDGFEVTLYADDDLAHDIFCMTTDSRGRVVVSGMGYVRILEDTDGDGRADSARQFVDGPATGAQGMFFYGRDLLCSGDGGLVRYRDQDGDDHADGPPEVFLKARTGGEHDIHAIRQGPDGWWYLIAGNFAGINQAYVTIPTSPVPSPQAGVILRLKPDLTAAEVVADGYRNAYSFDFHPQGDLFTFDSDGERDVALPWYLPTRLFQVAPGSHAGWFSQSWKRPDHFLDMPPVVASFGRGSPTGVICYRHMQFPEKYRDSLFILDWTYGRVFSVTLAPDGSTWTTQPEEFMKAVGQFGFAPTDATVGPDGSLYICVGGRGTRGGVYRIRWSESMAQATADESPLDRCLKAPQPLSSWSRRQWEPLSRQLGAEPFIETALSSDRPVFERVRSIEILTEKFGGVTRELATALSLSRDPEVRARTAWSLGRSGSQPMVSDVITRLLNDQHPLVIRVVLESLLEAPSEAIDPYARDVARHLASQDRFVRQAAVRVVVRMSEESFHETAAAAVPFGWQAGIGVAQAYAARHPGLAPYSIEIGTHILQADQPPALKYEAVRLIQLGLGDLVPEAEIDPAFEGYSGRIDLTGYAKVLDPLRIAIAGIYPTGNSDVDWELARIIAMLQPANTEVLDRVLAQITDDSHPTDDVHHLIVAARIPVERTSEQRARIARALVGLEHKIESRGLIRDSSWDDRIIEMYVYHVDLDPLLPEAILELPELGQPGHVNWVLVLPEELQQEAVDRFVSQIRSNPEYAWNTDVVFFVGQSPDEGVRDLIREQFQNFALQSAILMSLSEHPVAQDRPLFVQGLDSPDSGVLASCLEALASLESDDNAAEQVALIRTARRLESSDEEQAMRTQALGLLRRNTGQEFGDDALNEWTQWAVQTWPEEWTRQTGTSVDELEKFRSQLAEVDWQTGDAAHGHEVFLARGCHQCHGSRKVLGPDLSGVTSRFSREDLFTAIALPNRDVSPRYQTTLVATKQGSVHTGLIVYEAVDGLVLRTSTNQTLRIESDDIEIQRMLPVSLMPSGLLKDLPPADLSSLYAYLQTLNLQTATVPAVESVNE